MGFDEPKPFVYATRDFREHIRGVSILQLVGLINGLADFAPEGGQRFGNGFDVCVTVGNVEGISFSVSNIFGVSTLLLVEVSIVFVFFGCFTFLFP